MTSLKELPDLKNRNIKNRKEKLTAKILPNDVIEKFKTMY